MHTFLRQNDLAEEPLENVVIKGFSCVDMSVITNVIVDQEAPRKQITNNL